MTTYFLFLASASAAEAEDLYFIIIASKKLNYYSLVSIFLNLHYILPFIVRLLFPEAELSHTLYVMLLIIFLFSFFLHNSNIELFVVWSKWLIVILLGCVCLLTLYHLFHFEFFVSFYFTTFPVNVQHFSCQLIRYSEVFFLRPLAKSRNNKWN